MNRATMQAAEFIRKGPIPMARESFATLQSSPNTPLGKWRKLSFFMKYFQVHARAVNWQSTVAIAAPRIPMSST